MERSRRLAIVQVAFCMVAGVTPALAQDQPVSLRLAVSDFRGQLSEPYIETFVTEVARRTHGSVTIEPTYQSEMPQTELPFEQGVASLLEAGDFELGLAAARGWDAVGIKSLEALQTPFLITDDATAVAVARSSVADEALAGMASGGVTGLALWYEGLRHLVAYESCGGPFLSPADLEGKTIRGVPSAVTEELMGAYGASLVLVNSPEWAARVASCEIDGAESPAGPVADLSTTSVVTGDVVLYPKYQVLAANTSAFEHLSGTQQAAIREAAVVAAEQGTAAQPSEAELGGAVCDSGGRVVSAGPDGLAAFAAAAAPVIGRLTSDPATAATIATIRDIAKGVDPAPGAAACDPGPAPESSRLPEPTGAPASLPPAGTWRVALTEEDMLAAGAEPSDAVGGVFTWTFEGDRALFHASYSDGGEEGCEAGMQSGAGLVRFVYVAPCAPEVDSIEWSLEADGLHLELVDIEGQPHIAWNRAYLGAKPWQRVE